MEITYRDSVLVRPQNMWDEKRFKGLTPISLQMMEMYNLKLVTLKSTSIESYVTYNFRREPNAWKVFEGKEAIWLCDSSLNKGEDIIT